MAKRIRQFAIVASARAAQIEDQGALMCEQRCRTLVNATSLLVWGTNPEGEVDDIPGWRAMTRQTIREVRGWGDAIISNSLDGTVLTWNQRAERLYGYTAAERVGRSAAEL